MDSNSRMPTIRTENLTPQSITSEPEIVEKADKVKKLAEEKIRLDEQLKELEQRLKLAAEEAEKKRVAGTTA
ncbi:hypothetical protein FRC10_000202 [Ceratobasidium sp. 414]|nr:hypothetical protein FRC10_000202 [Ceratobasidium sp. 414]